jgi:hypothetical protein
MSREANLKQAIAFANEQIANMSQYELASFCYDRLVEEELERLNKDSDYKAVRDGK